MSENRSTARRRFGRPFRVVWLGQLVSQLGSGVSGFGVAVWVFDETGSFVWLGVLIATISAAGVAAAPFSGLVDRFDRRSVMLCADGVAATTTLVALLVWWLVGLEPWQLAIASVIGGFAASFQGAAYGAAVPDLVEPDLIDRANGLIQLGPAASMVLGPAGASLLFAGAGIGAVLAVDLVSFLVAVATLVSVRFRSRPIAADDDDRSIATAARWVMREGRPFAWLIGFAAVANLVLGVFSVVVLGLAADLGGAARAGWPATAGGATMGAATLVIGRRGLPARRVRALAMGSMWFGAFVAAAGLRSSFVLLLVGIALAFAAVPVVQTAMNTLFNEGVPRAMQGRVIGLRGAVGAGTGPLGSLIAGPSAVWSATGALLVTGGVLIVLGAAMVGSQTLAALDAGTTPEPTAP